MRTEVYIKGDFFESFRGMACVCRRQLDPQLTVSLTAVL